MMSEPNLIFVLFGAGVALLYGGAAFVFGAHDPRDRLGGTIAFAVGAAIIVLSCARVA